jgi:hypothetical protein
VLESVYPETYLVILSKVARDDILLPLLEAASSLQRYLSPGHCRNIPVFNLPPENKREIHYKNAVREM